MKPKLTGNDLMKEFGLEPGPQLKEILNAIREERIEGTIKTKTDEMQFVKKMLDKEI